MRHVVILLTLFTALAADAQTLRLGFGHERTRSSALRDRDCSSTQPPALFGCGFEARGDLGAAPSFEVGVGFRRFEVVVTHRELDLDAEANFTGVTGEQPVTAHGSSVSAMLVSSFEFGSHRLRPFVSGGAGAARNQIGRVRYAFPGIAENAATITRGGTNVDFAWSASAGVSWSLTSSTSLELALRYANLGEVRTDAGAATIVRPTRELTIDIDATRANVETLGAVVSLRHRM